jgi:hypothetical protein
MNQWTFRHAITDKQGLKNPYRRHEILKTCQVIYASEQQSAYLSGQPMNFFSGDNLITQAFKHH